MDGQDERVTGVPEEGQVPPQEAPKVSAAYLPYDDERLWLGMPEDQRRKPRARKRRPPARPKPAAASEEAGGPTRVSRLARPISIGRRQIAAAVLTLALPISAFAVTGVLSEDAQLPAAPVRTLEPTLTPAVVTIELVGLRVERVNSERVRLIWEAPELDGPLTYSVYRDGIVIAEATDTYFVDKNIRPQSYYYYAVAAVGSDGRTAASPQLLVTVPSESGELPEGPAPAAPAPIRVVPTSVSPSPSASPTPSKSKVVWPSTDFGGGGGGGTFDPCAVDPQSSSSCPNYDPCIANPQSSSSCPGYDPCLADPQSSSSCPGYDPCLADPQSSSSCPGYDPCLADPQSSSSCPGYDPCLANPSDPACVTTPAAALPPPPTLVPLLPFLPFRRRKRLPHAKGGPEGPSPG